MPRSSAHPMCPAPRTAMRLSFMGGGEGDGISICHPDAERSEAEGPL
jgi:hypothetical protein